MIGSLSFSHLTAVSNVSSEAAKITIADSTTGRCFIGSLIDTADSGCMLSDVLTLIMLVNSSLLSGSFSSAVQYVVSENYKYNILTISHNVPIK